MATKSAVHILDVAHGNSALVVQGSRAAVVDAPGGDTLLWALRRCGLTDLDLVVVSHADADHIGGLATLLTSDEFTVRTILVNPDPSKDTAIWKALRIAVSDARRRGRGVTVSSLTAQESAWRVGRSRIEILAPSAEVYLTGVGGKNPQTNKRVTSNSSSGVVRVWHGKTAVALLPGDMDEATLADIKQQHQSLTAHALIFPHHGGQTKTGKAGQLARDLVAAVAPELVIFSHGRERHSNPRPEVVDGVREAAPQARILCTQLSKNCSVVAPSADLKHLTPMPAAGRRTGCCCVGTLTLVGTRGKVTQDPPADAHASFVTEHAPSALCRLPVLH
jgi:competence protein ComEC